MSIPKYTIKDLNSYPGDMVIRARSTDIKNFGNDLGFKESHKENSSELSDSVTLTIIAETLEETSIVVRKLNKNVAAITNEIFEKLVSEYLAGQGKTTEWLEGASEEELDAFEEELEKHVTNLEGLATFKMNVPGIRKSDKKKFTAQVILRSNGGFDEILKAIPLVTNKDGFNRKVARILKHK